MAIHFIEKFPYWRFAKFLIIGGSALILDITIYYFLTREFEVPYLFSRVLSLGVAIFWNFYLNRVWTFMAQEGSVFSQFGRFVTVIGTTSLLNLALMHVGVSWFGFYDIAVIIFVSILLTLVNFFAHSVWSYAHRKEEFPL